MGERKGQNKYYPPDYDPKKGGLNKFMGTHALRERAKKLHLGILIIRFEMPYNIWCEGCGNHIGMGVRYNAEKKKVGMYYTTPIYQFRMKCHLCNNYFHIRTDPANLDYAIESGARRQEKRFEASENGTVVPDDRDTIKRLSSDPMFKLDRGDVDVSKAKKDAHPRINKITQIQDRVKDDYLANRLLRDQMRLKRKSAQATAASDKALLSKSSLPQDMKLLPESEEDVRMASLLRLVPTSGPEEKRAKVESESIFLPGTSSSTFSGKLTTLHKSLTSGVASSPFGGNESSSTKNIGSLSSGSSSSSSGSVRKSFSSNSLKIGVQKKIPSSSVTSASSVLSLKPEDSLTDKSTLAADIVDQISSSVDQDQSLKADLSIPNLSVESRDNNSIKHFRHN